MVNKMESITINKKGTLRRDTSGCPWIEGLGKSLDLKVAEILYKSGNVVGEKVEYSLTITYPTKKD